VSYLGSANIRRGVIPIRRNLAACIESSEPLLG